MGGGTSENRGAEKQQETVSKASPKIRQNFESSVSGHPNTAGGSVRQSSPGTDPRQAPTEGPKSSRGKSAKQVRRLDKTSNRQSPDTPTQPEGVFDKAVPAFILWMNDNRSRIIAKLKDRGITPTTLEIVSMASHDWNEELDQDTKTMYRHQCLLNRAR